MSDSPSKLNGISPRLLRALLTGSTNLVVLLAPDGTIVDAGASVKYLLGYEREEMIGRNVLDLVWPGDQASTAGILAQDAATAKPGVDFSPDAEVPGDYRVLHADGSFVWFEITRNNFIGEPDINGVLITGRRIGPRHVLTEALYVLGYDATGVEAMRQMLDYLDQEMPDTRGAIRVDGGHEWVICDESIAPICNGEGPWDEATETGKLVIADLDDVAAVRLGLAERAAKLGYQGCWCVPLPILQPSAYPRFAPELTERLEIAGIDDIESDLTRLGCLVVWTTGSAIPPGPYLAMMERVGLFAEIALRRKRDHDRIHKLLHYDHLTGALSRVGMQALVAAAKPAAHILLDLDDFKPVNDTHGHAVGDQLLRLATQRISAITRRDDRIVRLGGDEFLVLLPGASLEIASAAVSRLLGVFAEPFQIGSLAVTIGVSMGVAVPDKFADFDTLTERADAAMYAAKQQGKNQWAFWEADGSAPGGGSARLG